MSDDPSNDRYSDEAKAEGSSKALRIVLALAVIIFAIMYSIGRYYSRDPWSVPSPRPHGVLATASYGFRKTFYGDQFSNGEYIPESSLLEQIRSKNTATIPASNSSIQDQVGQADSSSPGTPLNVGEKDAAKGDQSLIDENVKFGQVGQCKLTTVAKVSNRLEDTPGSGSAINYADGTFGVSYDTVPGVEDSRPGDKVKLCLVSTPSDCPAGDDSGTVYSAQNLRTRETWSLPNSSHGCGGA